MPKGRNGECPLPEGWDVGRDFDGKIYFIDHINHETTWVDPRDRYTKPQTFADCIGDELPFGWEECNDPRIGPYFIDHISQTIQIEDPRQQWRQLQEAMLKEYLCTAQDDLAAKREILEVKQHRLSMANEELNQLNAQMYSCRSSTSICSSDSCSSSTKYDPDLLRADVASSKERVSRLKKELEQIQIEMHFQEKGLEALTEVDQQLCNDQQVSYTLSEAQAIMEELRNIHRSLSSGQREKQELMQNLVQLKDELIQDLVSPNVSCISLPMEKLSTASQTDLSWESSVMGPRLAEITRKRLQYEEARKEVHRLQQELADIEDMMTPGQLESDKDRLLLIQEKEQLLQELRSVKLEGRTGLEVSAIQDEISSLKNDLENAMELSNQAIAQRLHLHERKTTVLQHLRDAMCLTSCLEKQLKSMSASTLSMSSSSSLGSLSTGSLSTSSKGSLSSLNFSDIYGLPQCTVDPSIDYLQKRLAHLLIHQPSTQSSEECCFVEQVPSGGISLSPRSSLSSISPPLSLYDYGPPPSYPHSRIPSSSATFAPAPSAHTQHNFSPYNITMDAPDTCPPEALWSSIHCNHLTSPETSIQTSDLPQATALSPICELDSTEHHRQSFYTINTPNNSVSAAVSDESVAGDSGVFEAAAYNRLKEDNFNLDELNLETAQIQIKLRYSSEDNQLHVGVERARNLTVLPISQEQTVIFKLSVQPSQSGSLSTSPLQSLTKPTTSIGESFRFPLAVHQLYTKTLQVHVWAQAQQDKEECLGCCQISLADFCPQSSSLRWYNILSFRFMHPESETFSEGKVDFLHSTCDPEVSDPARSFHVTQLSSSHQIHSTKEESSDESTIISSQTSTLTRNQGPTVECDLGDVDQVCSDGDFQQDLKDQPDSPCEECDEECLEETRQDETLYEDAVVAECCHKETNTECIFVPDRRRKAPSAVPSSSQVPTSYSQAIKRSQTFSPSAHVNKYSYICRLNRSDSDSSVPLYRKSGPFQRNAFQRQSLRWKNPPKVCSKHRERSRRGTVRTSLDLALDLKASQSKLGLLQDEILSLKEVKKRLEEAKGAGDISTWLQENEHLQAIFAVANKETSRQTSKGTICKADQSEDKRIEKLMQKSSREIYKLRRSRMKTPDLIQDSFREKMAFFTRIGRNVPLVIDSSSSVVSARNPSTSACSLQPESVPDTCDYEVDPDLGVQV